MGSGPEAGNFVPVGQDLLWDPKHAVGRGKGAAGVGAGGARPPPHLPRLQRAGKGWLRVIKERDRKTLLKELSGKGAISGLLCASARDLGPEQTIAERSSGLLQQASQPEGCEGHEEHKGPLPVWDGDQAGSFGRKEEKRSLN